MAHIATNASIAFPSGLLWLTILLNDSDDAAVFRATLSGRSCFMRMNNVSNHGKRQKMLNNLTCNAKAGLIQ
jgi:hypothetical protein